MINNGGGTNYVVLTTGFLGAPFNVTGPSSFVDHLKMSFDPPVNAIGMDVLLPLQNGDFNVYIYDENGILLESSIFSGVNFQAFWGVQSDTPIGEVVFESTTGVGELVGNVAFGTVTNTVPISNLPIYLGILIIGVFIVLQYRRKTA